jgi:hypothetical protein
MNMLFRLGIVGALLLLLGVAPLVAQEVVFNPGPAVAPNSGASNGGFAWSDVNGDGFLDAFIPSNNVLLNFGTYFAQVASTKTVALTTSVNSVGGLFADINADGVPDLWSTNNAAPQTGLFFDSLGTYVPATGVGALASAMPTGSVFAGMAVADIDRSNYLSAAWHGFKQSTWSDGFIYKRGEGIELLKGGPSGFTRVGIGAAPGAAIIDTTRAFETWGVHFIDANNDGWMDLLMPGFRHGFRAFNGGSDTIGAKKGSILFLNDGTGKFIVPNSTTVGRTLYALDSMSAAGAFYARAVGDTGIIVEDTVRHFNAIGSQWGDLNNDGNIDLLFTGTEANNYDGLRRATNIVLLYGKGDGTFTFKWNGTSYVDAGLPTSGSIRAWDIGDYNNDGIPDIYASTTFGATRLFRGNGNGTFTEVTNQDNVATASGGRAGGFVDYDNNGFLDIYNYTGLNSVLQKSSGNSNHWIGFSPVGTGHNMSAIGAKFTLYSQGGTFKQYRWIKAEGNAAGQGERRALFGLGINTTIDSVVVNWPDGTKGTYKGLGVDKYWAVKEGSAIPGGTALVSPANGATSVAATGNLTWSAATSALAYSVQVSLDPTFANKALLAVNKTVTGATTLAYSLGAATKYYWRVAAVNGGFMSEYTAANNFTTAGAAAATVPTQVAPPNKGTNQPALLSLKVRKTADASRYQWQVSTLPSFLTLFANDSTADTTYAGNFTGGQTFYWRVRGMNDLGATAYSVIDTFTVMTPPGKTTLVAPANSAVNVVSDSVFFTWRVVSSAASYNLQVSTVNSTVTYSTTDTVYRVNGLAKLTNYTWKVEAVNAGGSSYFTATNSFTTVPAVPSAPSLVTPASAAAGVNRRARFVWKSSVNANSYRLQVGADNAFATVLRDTTVLDTTLVLATPLDASTDYYWRANAQNYGGASAWSSAQLFTTGLVLGVEVAEQEVPVTFDLYQNYPNPFNPSTSIRYDVPKNAQVTITMFDILGRQVTTLVNGVQAAGRYSVQWNATGYASGVYIYRMEARNADGSGNFTNVKKLILMK